MAAAGCGWIAPLHDRGPDESTDSDAQASSADDLDTGTKADNSAEPSEPQDADAATFCEGNDGSLFCDDFDEGAVGKTWTASDVTAGANVGADIDVDASPSRALHIAISDKTPVPHAFLSKNLADGPHDVTCSFDFVTDLGGNDLSAATLFTLALEREGARWRIEVILQDGKIAVDEHRTTSTLHTGKTTAPVIKANEWSQFMVSVTMNSAPQFELKIDGGIIISTSNIAPNVDGGTLETTLGVGFTGGPMDSWSLRYDNFLCIEK